MPSVLDPQDLNRYAYCLNDPLECIDPSGHWRITMPSWARTAIKVATTVTVVTVAVALAPATGGATLLAAGALIGAGGYVGGQMLSSYAQHGNISHWTDNFSFLDLAQSMAYGMLGASVVAETIGPAQAVTGQLQRATTALASVNTLENVNRLAQGDEVTGNDFMAGAVVAVPSGTIAMRSASGVAGIIPGTLGVAVNRAST